LGFVQGAALDEGIGSLSKYSVQNACSEKLFIPDVSIVRVDFDPERKEPFPIPLSWANGLKLKMGLPLTVPALKRDYDDQIPRLRTPAILAIESNSVADLQDVRAQHPSATLVPVD
jgi:hypothetical protein